MLIDIFKQLTNTGVRKKSLWGSGKLFGSLYDIQVTKKFIYCKFLFFDRLIK
jgi:hypothetical protein